MSRIRSNVDVGTGEAIQFITEKSPEKGVNSPCHEYTSFSGERVFMFDSNELHPSING
jgi:hypothetical protein